jgi:hypothetical protein
VRLPPLSLTSRWAIVVVLVFAGFNGPHLAKSFQPNSWLFADGSFYFTTVRALAEHGRIEQRELQPQSWYVQELGWNHTLSDDWSNVALGRNGGWYPKHAILLPLLSVPFYWLFGTIGTLFTNVLLNLLFVLLVFFLSRRFARVEVAAVVACLVCSSSFVQAMSYTFSNDLLGADMVLGALECAFAGHFGLAGILTGLSLWSRITNGAFLPALLVVGLSEGGWRGVRRAAGFSLIPLGLYGALNTYMFGAPWITSYQSVLVREEGVMKTASHSRLFNVPWKAGFNRIVFGADGVFKTFPIMIPGCVGILALALRRWATSLALVLFCLLPSILFLKYDWYRPHFLYPLFGVGAVGLAALIGLIPRLRGGDVPRWSLMPGRDAGVALVAWAMICIPIALAWRELAKPAPNLLSSHLREAEVRLDDIPCDYWNPQVERWECSSYDGAGWAMTGKMFEPEPVKGTPFLGIWLHPNPTRRWRRVIFNALPARHVDLTFALGDGSWPGPVEVEVRPRGHAPVALKLDGGGSTQQAVVEIGDGPGPALELRARASAPLWKHLVVQGQLRPD